MLNYDMETDFNQYLSLINKNKQNLGIIICGKGDVTAGLNSNDIKQLQELGCKTTLDSSKHDYSYIAVIDGGKLTYEKVGTGVLTHNYNLGNDMVASLYSYGNSTSGGAAINIDNKKYAINSTGLNIVLYDKESGCVIDSVAFNTHLPEKTWWRSGERSLELFMYKNYRNWVLENK